MRVVTHSASHTPSRGVPSTVCEALVTPSGVLLTFIIMPVVVSTNPIDLSRYRGSRGATPGWAEKTPFAAELQEWVLFY